MNHSHTPAEAKKNTTTQQAVRVVADRAPAWPEQVPEGEGDDVGGHDRVGDLEEGGQDQRLGEEHGVVEEGLADEQRQPEHGALGVELEGGVGDLPEADAAALADLDGALDLLFLRPKRSVR